MKNTFLLLTLVGLLLCVPGMREAHAHAYMVGDHWANYEVLAAQAQGILDQMMSDIIGCNLWSTSCGGQTAIWTSVLGQRGPGWVPGGGHAADHGALRSPGWGVSQTMVRADHHWAFLEEVLKPNACLDGVPPARVSSIRNAYNHNKSRVLSTEITVYGVRVQARVLGCDNDHTRNVTTGGSISMGIKAGSPLCPTVYTVNEGIPSLFGTANGGPLLNEAHPQLRDMLANMTAAYMTIGDSRVVDYWYAFMGRIALTFVSELLPGLISNIGKSNPELLDNPAYYFADAMFQALREITLLPDKSDKAYCTPWGNVPGVDQTFSVSVPVVGNVNIRVSITDSNVCHSIRTFADTFNCTRYQCLPDFLGVKIDHGDLNADGTTNYYSYFMSGQNLAEWKVQEGAGGYIYITQQPTAPAGPINYGGVRTFNVAGASSMPISYQWYSGTSPGNLQPIPGASTSDYTALVDFYSVGETKTYRYYRADISTYYCNQANVVQSNVVAIEGGNPPTIGINSHPVGGNFMPGAIVPLEVKAEVIASDGLTYQWQKYISETWTDLPGKTSAIMVFEPIQTPDSGQYRVRVTNQIAPSPPYSVNSNSATVNVAPAITITEQPQGAELLVGENHTLNIAAQVAAGTLEYRWQRNVGFGYQNLTSWGAGNTSWDIVNVAAADAGIYRCQVRNTLAPFGEYMVVSEGAVITISSGTVFYVDPTSPGPQDGLSWETAFHTLQPAIDAAEDAPDGAEVWVAGGPLGSPIVYGEYRTEPWGGLTGNPGRVTGSLIMKDDVRVYGGFEGWRGGAGSKEQYRDQRVLAQNIAVIDGSTARGGEAAYHVVVFGKRLNPTNNAILDGFTITGGNAAGISDVYHAWRGGGIYNWGSSPTIANCVITGNTAAVSGGGIANENAEGYPADAIIVNCVIAGNHANRAADDFAPGLSPPAFGPPPNPMRGGGGIFNNLSNPTMRFVTIRDNTLGAYSVAAPEIHHALGSGGIFSWASQFQGSPILTNAIVWGNTEGGIAFGRHAGSTRNITVTYTDTQGGAWSGPGSVGNISANPLLDANHVPQTGSPVINTGDPAVVSDSDIRGLPRPIDGRVEMGAVEVSANPPVPVCYNTVVDFYVANKITDVSVIYNANETVSEAPIWKVELEDKTFGCGDMPYSTLDLYVTDILGRTSTCTADINVTESRRPVGVANPITVELLHTGQYVLTEDDQWEIADASWDNCSVAWLSVTPTHFTCIHAGRTIWTTLYVMDFAGNADSVSTPVTVLDTTPPIAICNSIDVELSQFGVYNLTIEDLQTLAAGSTDACGVAWGFTSSDINQFSCAHVGPTPVTITVVDNHGNASQCNTVINVLDVTPPAIYGVRQQAFSKYEGDYTLAQALEDVTANDFCSGDLTAYIVVEAFDEEDNPVSFPIPADFDLQGGFSHTFTLRYSVEDNSLNETWMETTLVLYDLLLPEITMEGDSLIIIECPEDYFDPGATAWDPQNNVDITHLMETVIAVNKDVPGMYEVVYHVFLEDFGIGAEVKRDVHVIDSYPPVLTMLGETPMGLQTGDEFVDPGVTAWDACAGDLNDAIIVEGAVDSQTPGEYLLTYRVTDGAYEVETSRTVFVGDLLAFTEHPEGARLYTTSPPHVLSAGFEHGVMVSGHEWWRVDFDAGIDAPTGLANTFAISVYPSVHPLGEFAYRLVVHDAVGAHHSNAASVEIAEPLTVTETLNDKTMLEGESYQWRVKVEGGLGTVTYQWQHKPLDGKEDDFMPVVNGKYPHPTAGPGTYGGATTHTLSFSPFTEAMLGLYQVEVSDDFSTVLIGPAMLSLDVGVPATSVAGLAALAMAAALGAAALLRKKK